MIGHSQHLPANRSHIIRLTWVSNSENVAQSDTLLRKELEVGCSTINTDSLCEGGKLLTVCSSHVIIRVFKPD